MASIDKRTWKKPAGGTSVGYRVRYEDERGQRRERNFRRRGDAVAFQETLSQVRQAGTKAIGASRTMTFPEAAESFLTACARIRKGNPPLEPTTIQDYQKQVNNRLLPIFGSIPVGEIEMHHVEDALATLVDRSAPSQVRKNIVILRAILNHAIDLRVIDRNPAKDVRLRLNRRKENGVTKRPSIHSKEEMSAILTAARSLAEGTTTRQHWGRLELMLNTMVFAGLRMSELRGLPPTAIDGQAGTLTVSQRADMDGRIGPPKSASSFRTIYLPKDLAMRLQVHCLGLFGLAFPTRTGKPISHANLANRMWKPVQEKAGVTILNPHSIRHFFASMLIDQGAPLKVLQEQMGHSDPMFTMRVYGHLFTSAEDVALREAMAEKMARALSSGDEAG